MHLRLKSVLGLGLCAVPCIPALGQSTATPDADALDAVVVIGERGAQTPAREDLAGSIDVIARSELEDAHVDDTSELFNKLPGVYLSRYNQGLINSDLSIRGFSGDGETPHAKLLIDGIPSNLHNGFGEMDQLFPIGIGSITVFKGTSEPTVGLLNIAGNYRIETRRAPDARELEVAVGSYDARELQGYFGFSHGRLEHGYAFGYRSAGGYRDRTDLRKYAFSGYWDYRPAERTRIGLVLRGAGYEADSAGYLTRAESRSAPRSSASYADQDGGEKSTRHASLHLDHAFGDRLSLTAKAYAQHFERERWVRFSPTAALQNRFDDQDQRGFIATLAWQTDAGWRIDGGVDAEYQDVVEQRFGTIGQARIRDRSAVLRDRRYEFDVIGAYLRMGWRDPDGSRGWNLALRGDRIDGDYAQFNAAGVGSGRDIFRFGTILQPKLNAFHDIGERASVFANYGRSFQHPFGADAYTAGDRGARDVSINDGWEAGAKWRPDDGVEVRLSYWEQKAKDEFVVVDGVARNVGRTARDGVDLAFNWNVTDRLYVWGNYTTVDARIVRPADSRRAFVGNRLRGVPATTGSLGMRFEPRERLSLSLHVDHQGDYHVNEANAGGRYGGYVLAHADAEWRFDWGSVGLQINNLFDRYHEYVFDFSEDGSGTIHSPGDGRAFGLSVEYEF
jgi:iron complex outermembrane receptor protein